MQLAWTHSWAEVASYLPQTDIDVCSNARLLVQLTLGKMLQQLVVQHRVTQLWSEQQHRLEEQRGDVVIHVHDSK